jgi:leucyl/phenylalanyl-tRNA--protein transferase
MPVFRLIDAPVFPDPREAEPEGLLAVGGDLRVARLLAAYSQGIFPWYGEDDPILWWSPPERALILPGQEHIPVRAQRAIRRAGFEVRADTAFERVIQRCARIPRPGQEGTWITTAMMEAYIELHHEGYAHSIETWAEGELVGGLYGLSLGAAFFGESMFSDRSYASRAAFAGLCRMAVRLGFHFIDGQLPNRNLLQLGAVVIPRQDYLARLSQALKVPGRRGSWRAAFSETL